MNDPVVILEGESIARIVFGSGDQIMFSKNARDMTITIGLTVSSNADGKPIMSWSKPLPIEDVTNALESIKALMV